MTNSFIINPILKFKAAPTPDGITARGKELKQIKASVNEQKIKLSRQLKEASEAILPELMFAEKIHLIAKMQSDSLAPTLTPTDLFRESNKSHIIAPAYEGYLIEIDPNDIDALSIAIKTTKRTGDLVDISRLESINIFDKNETLRGKKTEDLWNSDSIRSYQAFNLWLKPFKNSASRYELAERLVSTLKSTQSRLSDPEFLSPETRDVTKPETYLKDYLEKGFSSLSIEVDSQISLEKIISSGTIYRIEPCTPLRTTISPGKGSEPIPSWINPKAPTVVVIDGGVNAQSYLHLQPVTLLPLVPAQYADLHHGNKIASLICHAHAWNNNRPLPKLDCTFISAQVICKETALKHPNNQQIIDYLKHIAKQTAGYSRVWNLSFNQLIDVVKDPEISYLGHHISKIAREFDILPVISIGNTNHNSISKALCPPADCESALTVSGREFQSIEKPFGNIAPYSLHGPGPAGMKKPDLSWFGSLRMIGGAIDNGTSFCTPLVSSLAAHAFKELKDATPDLVRALLINRADLNEHHNDLGWGTPASDDDLPWHCPEDTVTLAWTAKLSSGARYYWHDIPIPDALIDDDKFKGTVALTAIIKPIVSELGGENYFATRIETSLQAPAPKGYTSLAGSMKESKKSETVARSELSKWSPVRHHVKAHAQGTGIIGRTARLYARIYARDLYQFSMQHHSETGEHEVAFVLTFKANKKDSDIYNTMVQSLGAQVESALVEHQIQVDQNNKTE